ncbi:MAG: PadR family transcriptional regulator [Candidatus Altiarchaeota archaeon]|nr:PadR family transcriptional regulator [Candidatus Altiarchaeota archaeon]
MTLKIKSMLKFNTLLLLKDGPKHGYEIMKVLEAEIGKISTSQVYPFLNELESQKLLKVDLIGGREKKVYKLTDKGNKFVDSMLSRFEELIDLAVKPRLTQCTHCGCKIYSGGVLKEVEGKKLMFCCEHCAMSFFGH